MGLFSAAGLIALGLAVLGHSALSAQHQHQRHGDSAYADMQERGRAAMGVEQYTSLHVFDALPDGGRIELQRPKADSAEVEVIRTHLKQIAARFAEGDFAIPGLVHAGEVPGTSTLRARRERVRYEFRPLPKGGEVQIRTGDREALAAIREFMAFQRREHRAGGRPK